MAQSILNIRRASTPRSSSLRSSFRPDIQGLRAFAVIVVILDHLIAWPSGGFVGVDVFFVLSGFLITGHLLREYHRTGHISFLGFYKKRIKRIMPAAVLTLVVTVGVSYLLLGTARFISILEDGFWALLFGANWRFAAIGTDYFTADGPVSPLQHFWSLAVEEQFYFVWPWLLLGAFWLFLRGERAGDSRAARVVAGAAIFVVASMSFAWSLHETVTAPGLAYFSTSSRVWELGVGAFIAVVAPMFHRIPSVVRLSLAWIGIVGLVISIFAINDRSPFPGPFALLPVLSAALIIAAGTGATDYKSLGVLTNPVSRYLGDISYSLYLWHFPAIILLATVMPEKGVVYYLVVIPTMVLTAVFAYHLVEDPVRKSGWLSGAQSRGPSSRFPSSYKFVALSFLATITLATTTLVLVNDAKTVTAPAARPAPTSSTSAPATPLSPALGELQGKIQASIVASAWPVLSPTMDEAIGSQQTPDSIRTCGSPGGFKLEACTLGDPNATKTAIVLGDSISLTLANPLHLALGDGWKVVVHGMSGCAFAGVTVSSPNPDIIASCPAHVTEGARLARELGADAVFISNTYAPRTVQGSSSPLTKAEWSSAVKQAAQTLEVPAKRIAFLSPPPAKKNPADCYTRVSTPADCRFEKGDWLEVRAAESTMVVESGWSYVDTSDLFCSGLMCPAFVGQTPVRSDAAHITIAYGEVIAPALADLLRSSTAQI